MASSQANIFPCCQGVWRALLLLEVSLRRSWERGWPCGLLGAGCSCLTLPLPPPRSFSELYTLSLQEPSRRGAPEPVQDEAPGLVLLPATKQLLHFCLNNGSGPPGPGDLAEERTEFLHSQNSPSPRRSAFLAFPLFQPGEAGQAGL